MTLFMLLLMSVFDNFVNDVLIVNVIGDFIFCVIANVILVVQFTMVLKILSLRLLLMLL